ADRVQAKDTEFEFYYQTIENVVQINNPKPEGWWETAKSWVKRGYTEVMKTWDMAFGRKYFTGEGTKRWYSREDHCTAYDVKRVKVKSEAHLLSLMGAESEAELTNGQKAMLAVYRHSLSQAVQERHQYGYLSKVKVILSDTSGYEDSNKYPHVERDFWPYSQGSLIQISSGHYNYGGSEDDAQSTFVHEYAHSLDRTIKEFIHPYGKDGSHFSNEMTKPRTAFVEGWAEFNEMLDSEYEVKSMKNSITKVRLESSTEAGKYTIVPSDSPNLSGQNLLAVEGINAMILYRLANEVPDGRRKIFETFQSTNWKVFRSLSTFAKDFARRYPEDAGALAGIIDAESKYRLSSAELIKFAGDSSGMRDYLENRPTDAAANAEVAASAQAPVAPLPQTSSLAEAAVMSAQDFAEALKNAHNSMLQAQQEYVEAVKSEADEATILEMQKKLSEKKQVFEGLRRLRRAARRSR
ncbi:MAG: hypothetical protein AB1403_14025, partial [Candidatus Riflebacteria bacterium]